VRSVVHYRWHLASPFSEWREGPNYAPQRKGLNACEPRRLLSLGLLMGQKGDRDVIEI